MESINDLFLQDIFQNPEEIINNKFFINIILKEESINNLKKVSEYKYIQSKIIKSIKDSINYIYTLHDEKNLNISLVQIHHTIEIFERLRECINQYSSVSDIIMFLDNIDVILATLYNDLLIKSIISYEDNSLEVFDLIDN